MVNNAIREFYFPASLCYDLVCSTVDVSWVHSFQSLNDNDQVCVLTKTSGARDAGLYVRDNGGWQMALSYEDMCSFLAGAVSVRIILNATQTQTVPSTAVLFRSGFKMPAGSPIEPSEKTIWIVVDSLIIAGTQLQVVDLQGRLLGNFLVV